MRGQRRKVKGSRRHARRRRPRNSQSELVPTRPEGPWLDHDLPRVRHRQHVHAERHLGFGSLEQSGLDHALRASHRLIRRLEDERHTPSDAIAMTHQDLCDAGDEGGMDVVAAGMIPVLKLGSVGRPGGVDRQGIHVGPNQQRLARVCSVEHGQHPGPTDAFLHLQAEDPHLTSQDPGGPHLLERQFRVPMQLPSEGDEAWCERPHI